MFGHFHGSVAFTAQFEHAATWQLNHLNGVIRYNTIQHSGFTCARQLMRWPA